MKGRSRVRLDGGSGYLTGGSVHPARHIAGDYRGPFRAVVDRVDRARHRLARSAGEPSPKHRIDHRRGLGQRLRRETLRFVTWEALQVGARVPLVFVGVGQGQHAHFATLLP